MSNQYKNPKANINGVEGSMFNENTKIETPIKYEHYGIYSNDNTYAITFNPKINRPPIKYFDNKPVRPPPQTQHITKAINEPPISITEGGFYLRKDKAKKPPLLPPYLNKPDEEKLQGQSYDKNKGRIMYYKPNKIDIRNIHY